jgi:hypothetical protein
MLSGPWVSRILQPECSSCYRPAHCHVYSSDTRYAVCTVISKFSGNCCNEATSRSAPPVKQRLCFNKMEHLHFMGNIPQTGLTLQFYCIYVVHGVSSLDTMHHCMWNVSQKQSYQPICCVIFQNCCLTKNQIIGTLCANLFSFSVIFHLELATIVNNNHH